MSQWPIGVSQGGAVVKARPAACKSGVAPCVELEARRVYGVWRYYPANRAAEAFALLVGGKTLELPAVERAASLLGMDVKVRGEAPAGRV